MQANPQSPRSSPAARAAWWRMRHVLLGLYLAGAFGGVPAVAAPRPPLLLGTAWYPEQWLESRRPLVPALMQTVHLHLPSPTSPMLTAGPARRTVALPPHQVSVLWASRA
ncbi:MAG: hypothetical protein ACYCT1_20180 [Steroidobacteraceae bacterium]